MPLTVVLVLGLAFVVAIGMACRRQHRQLTAAREETARIWERGLTRFNEAADLLPDILVELDAGQVITFANRAFTTVCGYTERDLRVGLTMADVLVPEQRPRLLRALARARDGGGDCGHQLLVRCSNGDVVPVVVHLQSVTRDGRFAGWRGVLRDLRDERRDDQRSRASRRGAEAVIHGIIRDFARTPTERWEDVVARALAGAGAFLGVDRAYLYREAAAGEPLRAGHLWYADGVTPLADDEAVPPLSAYPWVVENFARGRSLCVPDVSRLPDEAAAELSSWQAQGVSALMAVPWREDGEVRGLLGCEVFGEVRHWDERDLELLAILAEICADLCARQRAGAEEHLRYIGDLLPGPACVADAAGNIVAWNSALASLTGVPASAVVGAGVAAARARIDGGGAAPWPVERLLAAATDEHLEATVEIVGGSKHAWWRLSASAVPDRAGHRGGAMQLFQDVTDEVVAGRALRRRVREAERRLLTAREDASRLRTAIEARRYRDDARVTVTVAPPAASDR